jgi:hypothetical protein
MTGVTSSIVCLQSWVNSYKPTGELIEWLSK